MDDLRTEDEVRADEAAAESREARGVSREDDLEALAAEVAEGNTSDEAESVERVDETTREVDFEETGDTQFGTVAVQAPGRDEEDVRKVPNVNSDDDDDVVIVTQVRVAE